MSSAPALPSRPRSLSLPVAAVLAGAAIGVAAGLERPGLFEAGLVTLALLLLGALVVAGAARAAAVTGGLVYGGVLVWGYVAYFAPAYGYQGLVDAGPDAGATLVVVVLAALPAAWLPLSGERPSSVVPVAPLPDRLCAGRRRAGAARRPTWGASCRSTSRSSAAMAVISRS